MRRVICSLALVGMFVPVLAAPAMLAEPISGRAPSRELPEWLPRCL